ncbi:MAG: cysteine synthase family protein [Chloroflexi bacterium]|nr:cysteine synthase family protein [Chloroflexota bacterium]
MTLLDFRLTDTNAIPLDGLISHVGDTPLLPLRSVTLRHAQGGALKLSPRVKVFIKAEWFNPGGSVKDRPALNIIQNALINGDLLPSPSFAKHPSGTAAGTLPRARYKRLLDSTSGNMGISYATFGAALGIPVTFAIPASASPERLTLLRALGAEVVLTNPSEGSDGAILKAREMVEKTPDRYWYANQYNNPANWQAHYLSTGPEILAQTNGQVTHFIAGLGTSGTLMGTGKYLREHLPNVKILAFQPDAPFHGLEGLKHMPSAIKPGIYDESLAGEPLAVKTEAAYAMVSRLAREEGLFVGISSGAAAVAALQVASQLEEGVIVTIFPDAGYKYLSDKSLWETDNGR